MKHQTDIHNRIGPAILRTQMAEAEKNPWLASIFLKSGSRVLNRFIHFYRRLRAQPRRIRRFLQAKMATTLIGASLLLALSNTPAFAATINVDGTICTLVDAITAANIDAPVGGCIAGSGADIVVLQPGSIHALTSAYISNYGLPPISTEITIEGNGATIERASGASNFGILLANNSGDVIVNNVTINGGYGFGVLNHGSMEINNSIISNTVDGSGIENSPGINYGGSLTISDSIITGNERYGISNFSSDVVISGSTISNNEGIGVYNYEGTLSVNDCVVTGNSQSGIRTVGNYYGANTPINIDSSTITDNGTVYGYGQGGGIYAQSGLITVTNSTISGNSASEGGGIFKGGYFGGTMTINNSTVSGNSAIEGGGIFGGGDVTVNNSTISNNNALLGGGVFNYIGGFTINDSTITGNAADTGGGIYTYYDPVTLNRALVTGNAASNGREAYGYANVGNYNLFGYDGDDGIGGFTLGPTDIVPGIGVQVSNILDTTLQNNGGETNTHALVPGSPAVDAIPAASCGATTDQRGITRPQGPDCDIGAFELEVVQNQPPIADADGPYSVDEGSSIPLDGTNSSDPDVGDSLTYEWDFDYDGITFDVDAAGPTPTFDASNLDGPNSPTVALRVTDNAGASDIDTSAVSVNNVDPIVGAITAPIDPLEIGTPVNASASFTDPGILDTHTAEWDWGDNATSSGTVAGGTVTGSHVYAEPGVYAVTLTVTDDDGGVGTSTFEFIVVYDPDGGFVTGGGWIDSPAGAYTDDPSLSGTANFGFVSKYKKKSNVPTGNTEFNFQIADLNFHSDSYDWLVVNQGGSNAQFKGSGTINGNYAPSGELFKFMIWATDNDPGGDDTFRIKIWWEDGGVENIVYDNGTGQTIGGGNIKVHKAK